MTETMKLKHTQQAIQDYINRHQLTLDTPEGRELSRELELFGLALKPYKQEQLDQGTSSVV